MTLEPNLDEWNGQTIALTQALLGVISSNFRMVYLEYRNNFWRLVFILERDDASDREEIEDAVTQFEALQEGAIELGFEVDVNEGLLDWPVPPTRVVFCRREV